MGGREGLIDTAVKTAETGESFRSFYVDFRVSKGSGVDSDA